MDLDTHRKNCVQTFYVVTFYVPNQKGKESEAMKDENHYHYHIHFIDPKIKKINWKNYGRKESK